MPPVDRLLLFLQFSDGAYLSEYVGISTLAVCLFWYPMCLHAFVVSMISFPRSTQEHREALERKHRLVEDATKHRYTQLGALQKHFTAFRQGCEHIASMNIRWATSCLSLVATI